MPRRSARRLSWPPNRPAWQPNSGSKGRQPTFTVAGLFYDVSHFEEALACHELTLAMLDESDGGQPTHPLGLTQRLLSLHLQRGCLHPLRRMDEAVASARASAAWLERNAALLPEHEYGRELVRATLDLGLFLHEQHEYDEGSARLEEALTLMRKLREARPEEIILLQQEAHALFSAQYATFKAGQFDACRRWLDRLVGEVGGFLASPQAESLDVREKSHLTEMVGAGLEQLSQLDLQEGRTAEALEHIERRRQACLDVIAQLPPAQIDPAHRELVDAAVCQRRAELAAARGDAGLATEGFRRVIDLMTPQLAKPARQAEASEIIAAARAALDAVETGATGDAVASPAVLTSQP